MSYQPMTPPPGVPGGLPGSTPANPTTIPGQSPDASGVNISSAIIEEKKQKFLIKGEVFFYVPKEHREDVWWLLTFLMSKRIVDEPAVGTLARKIFFEWINRFKTAMEADIRAGQAGSVGPDGKPTVLTDYSRSPLGDVVAGGGDKQ